MGSHDHEVCGLTIPDSPRFASRSLIDKCPAEDYPEVFKERNPAIADSQVAEATLHLKGVTLRARDASPDLVHSINLCADSLAVQVKRHRDKRRKRREARAAALEQPEAAPPEVSGDVSSAA